jgi:hypothetical protein
MTASKRAGAAEAEAEVAPQRATPSIGVAT